MLIFKLQDYTVALSHYSCIQIPISSGASGENIDINRPVRKITRHYKSLPKPPPHMKPDPACRNHTCFVCCTHNRQSTAVAHFYMKLGTIRQTNDVKALNSIYTRAEFTEMGHKWGSSLPGSKVDGLLLSVHRNIAPLSSQRQKATRKQRTA